MFKAALVETQLVPACRMDPPVEDMLQTGTLTAGGSCAWLMHIHCTAMLHNAKLTTRERITGRSILRKAVSARDFDAKHTGEGSS